MKALVMACSTGGGHISCARAICKEMNRQGWEAVYMDPYTLTSQRLASHVGSAYVDLVQYSARLFGGVYRIGQFYEYLEHKYNLPDPVLEIQKRTAIRLGQWLDEHPTDLIVCSHPYPAFMVSLLKRQGRSLPASILVATDYTCIPFESDSLCDWMVIGAEQLEHAFVHAGVRPSMLAATGIPCDSVYDTPMSKEEACRQVHLDPALRYILMAGGSMGSSTLLQTISQIRSWIHTQENIHLIVSCGRNADLQQQLKALQDPLLHVTGFTDQMRAYEAACSVFLTKPGGLSITEAAAAGVPLLLCDPIPGCETENAAFFEAYGMALYARDASEIPEKLQLLLADTQQARQIRSSMSLAQKTFLPHPSARNFVNFAWQAVHLHARKERHDEEKSIPDLHL